MIDYQSKARRILKECNAFVDGGHFRYSSGKHGDFYLNKDFLYVHPKKTDDICMMLAEVVQENFGDSFDVVLSPTYAGVILGHLLSYNLTMLLDKDILSVYADKDLLGGHRVLRRRFREVVRNKRVLLADDLVTTGTTLVSMAQAVSRVGGTITGAAVICDRGQVRSLKFIPIDGQGNAGMENSIKICTLVELDLMTFDADKCPLCKARRPLDPELGEGYLEVMKNV